MKNILLYRNENEVHDPPCPEPTERRFAIVTIRRAQDAMDAAASGDLHRTKTPAADGEVVWSWRRDPGATLAGSIPPATGARKAASPGRPRISRKPIARGKPGCLGCTCSSTRVLFCSTLRTRDCGRSRRPAFPAPSFRRGTTTFEKLRRNCAVRTRAHVFPRH